MAIYDDNWFEIWQSEGQLLPVYLLIVVSDKERPGSIRVVDPFKNYEVVHEAKSYEEVCSWLWED